MDRPETDRGNRTGQIPDGGQSARQYRALSRTANPPPWQAATSPSPVLCRIFRLMGVKGDLLKGEPKTKTRSRAVSVERSAAAESPNPAPMGSLHSVTIEAVTPTRSMADDSSGEVGMTSRSAPSRHRRIIVTEVAGDCRTVAVTPSLMTIPVPILPVEESVGPVTCRKYPEDMAGAEGGDRCGFHG